MKMKTDSNQVRLNLRILNSLTLCLSIYTQISLKASKIHFTLFLSLGLEEQIEIQISRNYYNPLCH